MKHLAAPLFLLATTACATLPPQSPVAVAPVAPVEAPARPAVDPAAEDQRLLTFLDAAFEEQLARSPQGLTGLGRKEQYDRLNNHTDAFRQEGLALAKRQLAALRAQFDPANLTPAGRLSYRMFEEEIEQDIAGEGVTHVTAKYGPRLVEQERASYLRPTILHCDSPDSPAAHKEYMFPFAAVVACPQAEMLRKIGPTLVATVISDDESFRAAATHATNIDRLNLGPIPTTKLNWLQPHEGNLFEFLYRNRALQLAVPSS